MNFSHDFSNPISLKGYFLISILFLRLTLNAQTVLVIESQTFINNETEDWLGIVIPRSAPTSFSFINCSVTSQNASGYMLQAGDEIVGNTNNKLDNQKIIGNKFTWNGTNSESITHGIFTGYNINALIKYNYLDNVPMGIIRKSNGMINTSGGIAYNIVRNPLVAVVVKGMNEVKIYNNTFYSDKTEKETWRGLIDIYENDGLEQPVTSNGVKVFNNIFYTVHQIPNLNIYEKSNIKNFESDYNLFFCESGMPLFKLFGCIITFTEWQSLGFDKHSVVINPNFIDTKVLIPEKRLNYGKDLGVPWRTGLSVNAQWDLRHPKTTNQNGEWQVGAIIYPGKSIHFKMLNEVRKTK